jgi:wyosine [tRNA(Phe)-imidazoG37] synthetase (radical SAM superfamily)
MAPRSEAIARSGGFQPRGSDSTSPARFRPRAGRWPGQETFTNRQREGSRIGRTDGSYAKETKRFVNTLAPIILHQKFLSNEALSAGTAFGCPRDFLKNGFVYTVISPRAGGLAVGVNMNPDQQCNFDCVYCEVNRNTVAKKAALDIKIMIEELERTLDLVHSGAIREHSCYKNLPATLLELRHVNLSGDGEPTHCPNFLEAMHEIIHLRARGRFPFFKLVLITNASGLDRPDVESGLRLFSPSDEVWAKLDAGTQEHMNRVNKPDCNIEKILENILRLARTRPVIIQSLFPAIGNQAIPSQEVEAYIQRLKELKEAGARIPLVQVYSATRPAAHPECRHLSLSKLSAIARRVREATGLKAEVF